MFRSNLIVRLLSLTLCSLLLFGGMTVGADGSPVGDYDRDGKPTATDALYILQRSVGLIQAPPLDPAVDFYADANGDGLIDATDALLTLQVSVGLTEITLRELGFSSEVLPLSADINVGSGEMIHTVYFSAWEQWVEGAQQRHLFTEEQATDLLTRYDDAFFRDNALLYGIDPIPSAGVVMVEDVHCGEGRFLVTLGDGEHTQPEAAPHLVLVALTQEELRQSGCFTKWMWPRSRLSAPIPFPAPTAGRAIISMA